LTLTASGGGGKSRSSRQQGRTIERNNIMSIEQSSLAAAPDTPLLSSGPKAEERPGSQPGKGTAGKGTAGQGTAGKGAGGQGTAGRGNVIELYPGSSRGRRYRRRVRLMGSETGMATAEYAIATLAAVGFAGLLVFILRSDEVRGFLLNLIRAALALP
jgi:hypothetical protein